MTAPGTTPPAPPATPEPPAAPGPSTAPPVEPDPPNRRWLPTLLVLAVLLSVTVGGYVAAAALSVPAGPPVRVAGVLSIQPLSGWEVAGRSANPPGAQLTRGNGNLAAFAVPFSMPPQRLLSRYVQGNLKAQAVRGRLSVSPRVESVTLSASGLTGLRVSYVGVFPRASAPIEGEVTVAVSSTGVGVIFDGWAPQGLLDYVTGDIHAMIDRAKVG